MPGYSMETALVTLVSNLRRDLDRWSASLLVRLSFSAALDTIGHGINSGLSV